MATNMSNFIVEAGHMICRPSGGGHMMRSCVLLTLLLQCSCITSVVDALYTSSRKATATWYGEPNGYGSDGGNCGYGKLAATPYGRMIVAGNAPIYVKGNGCGACYHVRCTGNRLCSPRPIKVAVTDFCPGGGLCGTGRAHFDLSGYAFGAMAKRGQADKLRTAGIVKINYSRVPCSFRGRSIRVMVRPGSNPFYLSLIPIGGAGPGSIVGISVKAANSRNFRSLQKDWGASFVLHGGPTAGPFRLRLRTTITGQVIACRKNIPARYVPGVFYDCGAQFSSGLRGFPV